MEAIALAISNQKIGCTSLTASVCQPIVPNFESIPVLGEDRSVGPVASQAASDDSLVMAVQVYLQRKSRTAHPNGSFDSARRWYPSASEKCSNCDSIRSPSRSYPFSLMTHCRSVDHVAELFGVDPLELKRAARKESKQC